MVSLKSYQLISNRHIKKQKLQKGRYLAQLVEYLLEVLVSHDQISSVNYFIDWIFKKYPNQYSTTGISNVMVHVVLSLHTKVTCC